MHNPQPATSALTPFLGQPWLVEERDACGVGFIATTDGTRNHQLLENSLRALTCMEHRGGCSADRDSGDGSGLMTAIPHALFQSWFAERNLTPPAPGQYGVAMVFLPQGDAETTEAKTHIEEVVKAENIEILGWRQVPVRPEVLGQQALDNLPHIEQLFVTAADLQGSELDRVLYIARSRVGKKLADDFYICSFSCRTIVYKGMVRAEVLGEFYLDLKNPAFESNFSIYHRRFSTNTMPKWPLAQPMRLLGHNGEINTLLGNVNWMAAREANLSIPGWTETEVEALTPIVNLNNSDSANLDSTMELLVRAGRSPLEAAMVLVPEAYRNQPDLENHPEVADFYEYHSSFQEPWDGPALLAFSDGKIVGAALDRNGLRPARYCILENNYVIVASEAGVVPIDEAKVLEKGRLGPGQTIAVNLETGELLKNWDIKQQIAAQKPYGQWLQQHRAALESQPYAQQPQWETPALLQQQTAFGYTAEDVDGIIVPMASQGKEPTFCMGDDIPLAVLSDKPRLLYDYFKQRFAQVTNPPIDPLRESLVMSLSMVLGARGNLLDGKPEDARLLKLKSPFLNEAQLESLKTHPQFKASELSTLYPIADGPEGLQSAIARLCSEAEAAVKSGSEILILSDRSGGSVSEDLTYIPPLLAVATVHHYLIRNGLRLKTALVLDTAQCWSTHHFACAVGYGASAVCPYLALEAVRHWQADAKTQKMMERGQIDAIDISTAQKNYQKAIEGGLLKILSKMGISRLSSYHGAQIFEALGLGPELVQQCFTGTTSRIGGITLAELASEIAVFHDRAFPQPSGRKLENFGFINYKPGGEYHMNSPEMAKALHSAVKGTEYSHYEVYKQYLGGRTPTALRDLLDFKPSGSSVPLEEVEPVEAIVKRFCTGAMSLGSLSREAHETLAIAMNRLGGKSNSGEGGEDPARFKTIHDVDENGISPTFPHLKGLKNGDTASSAVKQIASGRFGVTPEYLMSGKQLEIKMAQGAKPGEGGQLPGRKVSPYIAMLRRSKPGVDLISPPPHHDIYSIEDLAQLIFDLHQINPQAKVSVKLVAEIGIGTIAAGVAKANADIIQISGHDGGTGASPLSSIKHAGAPWELGVTEVHRVLLENQLRDRVLLRADGGFKTGWDVVMAALMGAQEYGFGSVAMIAEGCIMARICHTNNCPVGVATQQEKLRARFPGTPGHVVNFFYFVAEEVRHLLAHLGYRSLEEIIGRVDLLQMREDVELTKTKGIDLNCLLKLPIPEDRSWLNANEVHSNGPVLDDELLAVAGVKDAIANQASCTHNCAIVNTDRSVGARVSGEIAKRYGNNGFEGEITFNFTGSAGQSFGAFNLSGMTLNLVGEANDYVGKGMHGGVIAIKPPAEATFDPSQNAIIGNTCLYGATGGALYANGRAGERFGVRNSKAIAVIEGAGDHCCEYMTGGAIAVLGTTGRNVGAGMTGGLAYFLDEDDSFPAKVNREIVKIQRVVSTAGEEQLKGFISAHHQHTGSAKAKAILDNWETMLPKFWQVVPPSEAESPEVAEIAEKTLSSV
ncbi:glutamate synthase-related protein [Oscillatoria sp. FACHB-1406]|uniref:glutamate synthase-related protein n=1 Tax=Oscillatoria sp. FACHB-1406 TaxID=2692846 RepID=UPI0016898695|nr:glutamate synthase-related protein [Oscillatoria sp. FACHB-1406]MBD2579185.1 glutamate synthase subunit alpha [Oscillatoria sp. FACHB-1406]